MAEKNPQSAAEDVPYLVPRTWAELMENERVKRGMGNNEFARYLSVGDKTISSSRFAQWLKGEKPQVDLVIHVAVRLGIPGTLALELAGYGDVAEFIAHVAGRTGPRAAALEPLIAQVGEITKGLPEDDQKALRQDMLDKAADWFVAAEVEVSRLRSKKDEGGVTEEDRGAI